MRVCGGAGRGGVRAKAVEADGSNLSAVLNRAAAQLERGDCAACMADCREAVRLGRAARADFKVSWGWGLAGGRGWLVCCDTRGAVLTPQYSRGTSASSLAGTPARWYPGDA